MIEDAKEYYLWKENLNVRMFGLTAAQNRIAFDAISILLDEEKPSTIVELGCGVGGLTIFMGIWAKVMGAKIYAYDQTDVRHLRELWEPLGINFICKDYMGDGEAIVSYIGLPGKTFLLCDGGNKKDQVDRYYPFLKLDDILLVHDYTVKGDKQFWNWSEIELSFFDNKPDLKPVYETLMECGAWGAFKKL